MATLGVSMRLHPTVNWPLVSTYVVAVRTSKFGVSMLRMLFEGAGVSMITWWPIAADNLHISKRALVTNTVSTTTRTDISPSLGPLWCQHHANPSHRTAILQRADPSPQPVQLQISPWNCTFHSTILTLVPKPTFLLLVIDFSRPSNNMILWMNEKTAVPWNYS